MSILTGDKNTDFEETAKMVNGFLRQKNKCPGSSLKTHENGARERGLNAGSNSLRPYSPFAQCACFVTHALRSSRPYGVTPTNCTASISFQPGPDARFSVILTLATR